MATKDPSTIVHSILNALRRAANSGPSFVPGRVRLGLLLAPVALAAFYSLTSAQAAWWFLGGDPLSGAARPYQPQPALVLSSGAPPVIEPIAVLPRGLDLKDFEPPKGTLHPKLESALSQLVQASRDGKELRTLSRWRNAPLLQERLTTIIETQPGQTANVIASLRQLGLTVNKSYEHLVQVQTPVTSLLTLADLPGVRFVRRPMDFIPQGVTSEGVRLIGAQMWQDTEFRGQGTKVAVIDIGFAGYDELRGSELPEDLHARSFIEGLPDIDYITDHGAAAAEILVDVAPDVELYLVTVSTEVELAEAVQWLTEEEVDIISFSLGVIGAPLDGSGILDGIVNRARRDGIFWTISTGNFGAGHWQGTFMDSDNDGWHEFSPGQQLFPLEIGADTIGVFYLNWNEWPATSQDYGFYLFWEGISGTLQLMAFSDTTQSGEQPPIEQIVSFFPPRGKYYIAVKKLEATSNSLFHLYGLFQDFPEGISEGSTVSPATAAGAVAVGATNGFDQIQDYSSRGPTDDGRMKPELVAPDTVSTVTYGRRGFPGTSAAAPHVAGAAALLRSAYPTMRADELLAFLQQHALRIGTDGPNNIYGAGRLQLPAAPDVEPVATSTPVATPTSEAPNGDATPSPSPTPTATVPVPTPTGVAWPDYFRYLPITGKQGAEGQ